MSGGEEDGMCGKKYLRGFKCILSVLLPKLDSGYMEVYVLRLFILVGTPFPHDASIS